MTALQQSGGPALAVRDRRATRAGVLPAWPVTSLFVLFPLWWLSGLTPFVIPLAGAICLFLMSVQGSIRLPPLWLPWTGFIIWMVASASMIDTAGRMVGFAQRWTTLVGASIIAVYVFNAAERLTRRRLLGAMAWFLGWIAVGGYLGMFSPYTRINTPMLQLMPRSIASNEYVRELLSPRFAEVQQPYGAPYPFVRPAAPFPYTNGWGHAFVLLLPLMIALWLIADRRLKVVVTLLVLAAVPPALATLNRGIFVGVAVTCVMATLRLRRRIRLGHVLLVAVPLGVAAVALFSSARDRIMERTSTSSTTADRASIYREAFDRTLESPLLGYGAPRPSEMLGVSVGTQGQFWYVMFSHGFVGLTLFLATIWGMALVTRRTTDLPTAFVHTTLVVVSVMLMFYGLDGMNLLIVLVTGALLMRRDDLVRSAPPPVPEPALPRYGVPPHRESHAERSRRWPDVAVPAPGRPAAPPRPIGGPTP